MATTSSATSTNSAASAGLIAALGAGSGMNTQALAQNLVDAEKTPQAKVINDKIDATKKEITGYSGLMYVVTEVKKAFDVLADPTQFAGLVTKNSQPAAFDVITNPSAQPGMHDISVTNVAKPQRSLTKTGFADSNSSVVSGSDFTLTLVAGTGATSKSTSITVPGNSTLIGVRDAINSAKAGVTAQVIDSGVEGAPDRYKIMLTGQPGANNAFTLSSSIAKVGFNTNQTPGQPDTTLQAAVNANIVVDGISYSRSSNSIPDVVPGVTFDLLSETSGSSATIQLSRDTSDLKTKVDKVVSTFNDFQNFIKIATDPKSDDPDFGGTLSKVSIGKTVQAKLKQMIFGTAGSTTNNSVRGLRDLGVKLQQDGTLTVDATVFQKVSTANYDKVVTMFSGKALQNEKGATTDGVAVSLTSWVKTLVSAQGPLLQGSQNDSTKVTKYQDDLAKLQTRMDGLLARYTKQFAAMDSIVGKTNSLKTSLTSTFDGMMKAYSSK
jgi:flagellar hook-associated protein 2